VDINEETTLGILQHKSSLIVFTNQKIAFARLQERSIVPGFCESGLQEIQSVVLDPNNIGVIYASTSRNEILVFDSVVKADNVHCKLRGRLTTPHLDSSIH